MFQAITAVLPDDISQLKFAEDDGTPRKIPFSQLSAVREAAKEFETVLKAELNGWDAFFVSPKGGFGTSDLINQAENILPQGAHAFLTDESREDIRQAGRCLAFNLGTAAAFHMVRATEAFIWKYYDAILGALPPVKMRNWGAYVKNLKGCPKNDPKVTGWMEQIRSEYRNPVLHPNETVSPEDALEFVYACISLMMCIARAMTKLQSTPALQSGSVNP